MPDRSITAVFRANIGDYEQKLQRASRVTRDAGKEAQATGQQLDRLGGAAKGVRDESGRYVASADKAAKATAQVGRSASLARGDLDQLGIGMGLAGAAIVAGLGKALMTAASFEQQIDTIAATSDATTNELLRLRDAALDAGAKTAFSASEAASAITELGKAGVSTADILGGGLAGALDLAAVEGMALADAATVVAQTLNTFRLEGDQAVRVADVLAAGSSASATNIAGLAQAMQQSGLVAAQFGIGLEENVGVLAAFAQNSLIGSDAGTSLKTALQRLVPQSDEAAAAMQAIGLEAFDAQGNFVGLETVAGQLQSGLAGLTEEQQAATLTTIGGSDAIRAYTLLAHLGATGVAQWSGAVDDSGAAAEMASRRLDNLKGDMEAFGGSLETAAIDWGENAQGVTREVVQAGTGVVNFLGSLPEPVQNVGSVLGGLVGVAASLGGGFLLMAPKIDNTRQVLAKMAAEGSKTAKSLRGVGSFLGGPWGVAIGGAVVGLGFFAAAFEESRREVAEMADEMVNARGEVEELTAAFYVQRFTSGEGDYGRLIQQFDQLGLSARDAALALVEGGPAVEAYDAMLLSLFDAYRAGDIEPPAGLAVHDQVRAIQELRFAMGELNEDQIAAAEMAELNAAAMAELGSPIGIATDKYNLLRQAAAGVDLTPAQRQFLMLGEAAQFAASVSPQVESAMFRARNAALEAGPPILALGDSWSGALGGIVAPVAAYEETVRRLAQTTADESGDATDTWQDFADDVATIGGEVTVTVEGINAVLQEQVLAQQNAAVNFTDVLTRIAPAMREALMPELERLMVEAPEQLALLASTSQPLLDEWVDLAGRSAVGFTDAIQAQLEAAAPTLALVGRDFGDGIKDQLIAALADGVITSGDIAWAYTESLRLGVNPLLEALGAAGITPVPRNNIVGYINSADRLNSGGAIPGGATPVRLGRGDYTPKGCTS